MLKRTELRHLTADILKKRLPSEVAIYDTCDLDIDAMGHQFAINIKTLTQNASNSTIAAAIPILESKITLRLVVYCQDSELKPGQITTNYGDILDELCEKIQWALLQNTKFLQFGVLESFNTSIDDGTGANTEIRDGGALLEFVFSLNESPCEEYKINDSEDSNVGFFKIMANKFETTDISINQKINLPGPWPDITKTRRKNDRDVCKA